MPLISKIFEKVFYQQIEDFSNKILSPNLCGFRKGHSTQHTLLNLLKKLAKCLDKSGVVRTVLMGLGKACDCLPQYLLLEKLSAYGFDKSAITLIANYLSNRYQRVKIGSTFGSYLEILRGVPESSILAPILFNLFINDLIFFIQETEVVNPGKFQIMFLGSNIDNSKITFMIENKRVKSKLS